MSWQAHLPDGISEIQTTDEGFTASVSLPVDDDGFFGRDAPERSRGTARSAATQRLPVPTSFNSQR